MNTNNNIQQPSKMLLATSLAPRDIDNQRQAVQSWLAAGFDVISINNADEIQQLAPHFTSVRFFAAKLNGQKRFGRPLILIDDMLDTLRASGVPIVGIINSDIHLHPDTSLWQQIARQAKNGLLYIRRTNVDNLGDPNGKLSIKGIDLFLMSQSILRQMPSSQFCLGVSWWDCYFPAYCAMSGIPLKKIDAPIAFHINHTMNWDRKQWVQSAEHFYECMYNLARYADCPSLWNELESQFLSLWQFYYKLKNGTITAKGNTHLIGSKLAHHIIDRATQTLDCPAMSPLAAKVPVPPVSPNPPAAPAASQLNTLSEALRLFQQAQQSFESGQMVSARRLMARYQSSINYDHLPRIDRRKPQTAPAMSVIIVTCNRSSEVSQLLDCLRTQTYQHVETLLVDNGNTDLSLVQNKADCIIQCPINYKPAEGRNIGAHFARGPILVFIDDDALIPNNYLAAIDSAFRTHRIMGLRGKTLPKTQPHSPALLCDLGDAPFTTVCNQEGNAAFLAWAWRAVGGQDPLLFGHEGIDLSWRLMQAFGLTNAIIYWPDAVIYHDYGDMAKMRDKNIRYFHINNYLRYKYDDDITQRQKQAEHQPIAQGDSRTWSLPLPAGIARWHSLCFAPNDTAIRSLFGVKVSIIISCYNGAEFLNACLDSICAQTLTDWEAIIVDDGSTDNSVEILNQYAARDSRFRIYANTDNKGPYIRRNFAIQQARSQFIVLHDADDLMAPQKLEILLGEILKDDRLGIVGAFYGWFMGTFTGLDCCDRITGKITHEEMLDLFIRGRRDICCHAASIIRKSLFDTIGLYDTHPWGADSFWLSKAAIYGLLTNHVRYKNIPEFLSFIRKHSQSQTGKINPNDPRGRRCRLVHFFREKLQRIVEAKKQNPALDVAAALKECTCSDFIPLYGHLFEQWESAPVDMPMLKSRMDSAVAELSNRMTVRTQMLLDTLGSMYPDAEHRVVGFNLLCGLSQFASGDDGLARQRLLKEYKDHKTPQAQRFIQLYLNDKSGHLNSAQRRKIVDDFVFDYPEIENPHVEVLYKNHSTAQPSVSVILDTRDVEIDFDRLIAQWAAQQSRDFELMIITHGNSSSDFNGIGRLPLDVVVVNIDEPVTKATARNLALSQCRGHIIAILCPKLQFADTFIQELVQQFSSGDISAVRGRILAGPAVLPRPQFDLGARPDYCCLDTDKLCAVRRAEIEAHGGFAAGLFGTDMLGLSFKIYNPGQDGTSRPILYLPNLAGTLADDDGKTDYLLWALGKDPFFWYASAPKDHALFMQFVENYYDNRDTAAVIPQVAVNIMNYFIHRCTPAALQWGRRAIQMLPDNIDAAAGLAQCEYKAGDKDRAVQLSRDVLSRSFVRTIETCVLDPHKRQQVMILIRYYTECMLICAEYDCANGRIEQARQAVRQLLANANVVLDDKNQSRVHAVLNYQPASCTPTAVGQPEQVSIIMPAYNAAQFIGSAIRSILAQTCPHFELILINDGSTDTTETIVREFGDPRIRIEFQSNAGPSAARNRGIQSAKGQYIIFLDADDAMTPEFIADHLREFQQHPQADLVYCDDLLMDAEGKPLRVIARRHYGGPDEIVRDLFRNGYPIVPFRTCLRKRVFDKIGLYDPQLHVAEDYDMIRRFFAAGLTARYLDKPHYLRRMAPQSQSRYLTAEKSRMHLAVVNKFIETFDPGWLFPEQDWHLMDTAAKKDKLAVLTAEFFLSLSLNYMKMSGHEVYAECALQMTEKYIGNAPDNPELRRVINSYQQTQQVFERWQKIQSISLSNNDLQKEKEARSGMLATSVSGV